MGRASFGGASDYSSVFAGLYNQAAGERRSQIDNAMNEAKRVAQAEDESLIEAWKKGTVSDAELLERLAMRRDEAMDDVDKNAFSSLYNEYKEAIADGKAKVKFANNPAGLIAYYQKKLKGLNPNSAGYRRAQLEIVDLQKLLTPDNDGRKNTPATLTKIQSFVDDETDYKLLLVQAYEGGMNTWPPSTANGLTQAQVDILVAGAATYDVPTGGPITAEYIDGIDAEIITAMDTAINGAPAGSKAQFNALKTKYLADHVSLHNDFQQQQILTDPDGGILATALAGLGDSAVNITDPADLRREMQKVRDAVYTHFIKAGETVATDDNKSGGATSNEYQILGTKMVAIMDDIINGKTTAAQGAALLSSTIAGFPDSKDNWVGLAFTNDIVKSLFSRAGDQDPLTLFEKMQFYGQGYAGMKTKPPTTSFAYDYKDGAGFVPVREVTTMVDGKPVKKYEPVLPVPQPKEDGTTDAWTMVAMDVDGVPTLVPALASLQTTGVPMGLFDPKTGQQLTTGDAIKNFYKSLPAGADITKYLKPAVTVYSVKIGETSYSYVGGGVSANGTLAGGTWIPTTELGKVYRGTAFNSSDTKLNDLLKNTGLLILDNNAPYNSGALAGEPVVYLGDNQVTFRLILEGKMPDPSGILTEANRHGIGFVNGDIDEFDIDQAPQWWQGYDGISFSGPRGFSGGGGRRPGAPGAPAGEKPKGGLSTTEKWNAASEGKALFHYDKDYIAYTNLPPKPDANDPIANILGGAEEEEPFRYAPRVPGNAFSPAAVSEYAATAQERDRNVLPKISIADSWDRGIKTLPTAPTPPGPTPTPPSTTPTPTGPKPPTPPRGPSAAGPIKL